MPFGPRGREGRSGWQGALAVVLAVLVGCSSTSTPSPSAAATLPPSAAPRASSTSGAPSTGLIGPVTSGPPELSPSPGESTSPPTDGPSPAIDSPGPSGSLEPAPTPDPDFIIPDWAPWPARDPGAPSVIVSEGPSKPIIALTIDDGNFPDGCRQEFGYLSANHIPATFFPDWVGVNKNPHLWREIAAAGYPIGNHTLTHLQLAGSDVHDHSVQRQLAVARKRIEAIIRRPMLPVWRPPYGAYDARDLRIAGELGLHTMVLWSATDADSALNSKPAAMIRTALRARRGAILLTHCNSQTSADILPRIVQGLLARGYTFVTIPEMLRPHGLGG
jgi:peptidoglycan/xylan/chitin deacetylase (PgdA/CDA1 family)